MKSYSGHIFRGLLGAIAIIAAGYIITTATGHKRVLVKTASAETLFPESAVEGRIEQGQCKIICPEIGLVKVQRYRASGANVMVPVNINGTEYPARIDTGLGYCQVSVGANLIDEQFLRFSPMGNVWKNLTGGICYLPVLRIGAMQVVNPQCSYFDQQWETQRLGVTVEQENYIAVGLGLLEKFKYVKFDNARREVEFGLDSGFDADVGSWQRHRFVIEADGFGQKRLFVFIPIEGQLTKIMFDSCGGEGLKLSQGSWNRLRQSLNIVDFKSDAIVSAQFGAVGCKKAKVEKLNIGGVSINNAEIMIMPSGGGFIGDLLPMDCFGDRAVVLDFENRLFYVSDN
jgi:hypothetical protein